MVDSVRVKLAGVPATSAPRELNANDPDKRWPTSLVNASRARLDVRRIVWLLSRLYQLNWLFSCTVWLVDDERNAFPPNDSDLTDEPPSGSADVTRTIPSGSCWYGSMEFPSAATPSVVLDRTPNQK